MSDKLPLSVLLLARDEAARLEELLPTLAFAREIVVVVDAATRDASRAVAERHGARVYERALDGFGAQRQFALERCTEDWVLWIDADERLDATARRTLEETVRGGRAGAYRWERHSWFLGRRIRHCGWQGEKVTRLFRRADARFDDAPVHERLLHPGPPGDLAGALEHHSYADWSDCVQKLTQYAAAGARRARAEGRRAGPLDLVLRPPLRFLRMYVLQRGFLDGAHGVALCGLASAQVFLKYADLWAGASGRESPP